mmetsp:Transcript_91826/g.259328  ORF Transcript_91826/g.259328 Transcript_91826/m.259328 type:complete len:220 (+) Transcript_91826:1239-1898(+)
MCSCISLRPAVAARTLLSAIDASGPNGTGKCFAVSDESPSSLRVPLAASVRSGAACAMGETSSLLCAPLRMRSPKTCCDGSPSASPRTDAVDGLPNSTTPGAAIAVAGAVASGAIDNTESEGSSIGVAPGAGGGNIPSSEPKRDCELLNETVDALRKSQRALRSAPVQVRLRIASRVARWAGSKRNNSFMIDCATALVSTCITMRSRAACEMCVGRSCG